MASPDNNVNKPDTPTMYGGSVHIGVGTVDEEPKPQSKMAKFYRSVLFQMILFGA